MRVCRNATAISSTRVRVKLFDLIAIYEASVGEEFVKKKKKVDA